jgi:hypothetical protein
MRTRSCIPVLLALSCSRQERTQDLPADRLAATVGSFVPRGSSVDSALATLGAHGLQCTLVRDGTAFGSQHRDYILCPMFDTVATGQMHAYEVGLLLTGGTVTGVLVRSTLALPRTN